MRVFKGRLLFASFLLFFLVTNKIYANVTFEKNLDYKKNLKKLAASGDKNAQCDLGILYYNKTLNGSYGFKKPEKSLKDIFKNGLYNSMNSLALEYKDKTHSEIFAQKAISCLEKSETPRSLNFLGNMYSHGKLIPSDEKKAFEYYSNASDFENAEAFNNLGICYYNGFGCKKNLEKAFYYYKKAADLGDVDALNNLGKCYFYGNGTQKNRTNAMKCFRKAFVLGSADALANIGNCYYETKKNKSKSERNRNKSEENRNKKIALFFYNLSISYNSKNGMNSLANYYKNEKNELFRCPDVLEAEKVYKQAIDLGSVDAILGLADLYYNYGIFGSTKTASKLMKKAPEEKLFSLFEKEKLVKKTYKTTAK